MTHELGYIICLILGVCVAVALLLPKKKNSTMAKPSSTFYQEKATNIKTEDVYNTSISKESKCERTLDKTNEG